MALTIQISKEEPGFPSEEFWRQMENGNFRTITSSDHSFGYPIICPDTIYNIILFIDTSTMLETPKLILELGGHIWL